MPPDLTPEALAAWPLYSRRSIDMPWDPRYGPYNEGFGIDDYDDGTDDPLWEITYPEEDAYCVTPGCDCCDDPAGREIERRFLGDVTHWKPTGLLQPSRPSQQEEPS